MYKRVLLKLSGEALAADRGFGVDVAKLYEISKEIAAVLDLGGNNETVDFGGSGTVTDNGANATRTHAT